MPEHPTEARSSLSAVLEHKWLSASADPITSKENTHPSRSPAPAHITSTLRSPPTLSRTPAPQSCRRHRPPWWTSMKRLVDLRSPWRMPYEWRAERAMYYGGGEYLLWGTCKGRTHHLDRVELCELGGERALIPVDEVVERHRIQRLHIHRASAPSNHEPEGKRKDSPSQCRH